MQFIGTGDRILTENFNVGYLYTITFKTGIYINSACIGIGDNFVMFQKAEPDLLFTLNVDTANEVDTIELYDSGGGTNDYDDLVNRPQINSHTLTGNMSGADLGLQNTISDLDTIRAGAAAGATAVQPADMTSALAAKQDALSTAQLAAVNSGITSTDVEQIETNKNNILVLEQANGSKNQINIPNGTYVAGTSSFSVSGGAVTSTATDNNTHAADLSVFTLKAGTYVFFDDSSDLSAVQYRIYQQSPDTRLTPAGQNPATFTIANDTVVYISCYTFKTGTMTTHPMLVTKTMWDAGFTDYQPYALSNAELTVAIQAIQAQLANQ